MTFAKFLQGPIPQGGKSARGLGVSDAPLGHPKAGKGLGWQRGYDLGCEIGAHALLMPNSLAQVKTSDSGLPQILWRANLPGMELSDKPYGDIAERLRWHRQLEGLEQKDYAEKAGLKRSQLSNWESGDYRLSLDGARALRKTYGLSLDFMFEGIDDALPMTLRSAWRDKS